MTYDLISCGFALGLTLKNTLRNFASDNNEFHIGYLCN